MRADDPRHGTDRGHATHMRTGTPTCEPCIAAHTRMNKVRRLYPDRYRKVPVVGSRRRIQALQALGYSRNYLAVQLGYANGGAIAYLMSPKSATVTQSVDKRIREVYDRLSMKPPPTGSGPTKARTWAARNHYAPPLAWDDDSIDDPTARPHGAARRDKHDVDPVVVDRILAGERLPATKAERHEVIRRWPDSLNALERLRPDWNVTRDVREMRERGAMGVAS